MRSNFCSQFELRTRKGKAIIFSGHHHCTQRSGPLYTDEHTRAQTFETMQCVAMHRLKQLCSCVKRLKFWLPK